MRERGQSPDLDREVSWLQQAFEDRSTIEMRSRMLVERTALALQASILLGAGNADIADAFCRSRLANEHGLAFGTLPADLPMDAIISRSFAA